MPNGTRTQQDAAKMRHLAKKPHARGHCQLCVAAPVVARPTTEPPNPAPAPTRPEPTSEWVVVKDLPEPVRAALKGVGYARADIEVRAGEKVVLGDVGAGKGRRSFTVLVDLSTGENVNSVGSWGGVNMFDRENPVDNDQHEYPLPPNGVAIKGSSGYGVTLATLHIPQSMVARMITAGPRDELPKVELDALYAHACIKGGQYRRDELSRRNVPASVVDDLVARGLLKRNKAGATSVTTDGRNALGSYRG